MGFSFQVYWYTITSMVDPEEKGLTWQVPALMNVYDANTRKSKRPLVPSKQKAICIV